MKKNTAEKLCGSGEDVRRWYENLSRASKLTADSRMKRLCAYCKQIGVTLEEFAAAGKKDVIKVENMLHDHVHG